MRYISSVKKSFYQDMTREEIRKLIMAEGFKPFKITNSPGYEYLPHQHPKIKILAILKGSMTVAIHESTYAATKGDKVIIASNDIHAATIGPKGCEFFWAEKIASP